MRRKANGEPSALDLGKWLLKHPHDRVEKFLDGIVSAIQSTTQGIQIFVVGYCFGGKHAFLMAKANLVTAAAAFHPVGDESL